MKMQYSQIGVIHSPFKSPLGTPIQQGAAQGEHEVFSTRAPNRLNPIWISVVRLVSRERNILHVKDLDIVDGTPLLDIKPYVPEFDAVDAEKTGWLQKQVKKLPAAKDDGRFTRPG